MVPQQGGEGIRGPITATPGSTVPVDVGPNDSEVSVVDPVTGESTTFYVAGGKTSNIPLPSVPGGTILTINVGVGLRARVIVVEIIDPGP